jgi:dTMP kinase
MVKRGHFIVVEGLEGAGKSTALQTIKQVLAERIPDMIGTREPGGTRVGEAARQLIKESVPNEVLDPRTELLLLYASRVQLIEQVILPSLNQGTWVVGDRFELSTWAYQGGGRRLDLEMIRHLSSFCLRDFEPDLTIFLDISPELGLARAHHRGAADRIESEPLVFFEQVYEAYHARIKQLKNVVIIDASQPLAIVQQCISDTLNAYMTEHLGHHD